MSLEQSFKNVLANNNQESVRQRFHLGETPVQWVTDPVNGREKFRITVHIDGLQPNEVNYRIEGNKLIIHGEHVEVQNQSSAKKIVDKSYELPRDIDVNSHNVTFPTATTMQVEFLSRHSNVIYQDGQLGSRVSSTTQAYRPALPLTETRSSSEFVSTRKIGTTLPSTSGSSYLRSTNSNTSRPYYDSGYNSSTTYGNSYSTDNRYESVDDYRNSSYSHLVPRYNTSSVYDQDRGQSNSFSTAPASATHNVEVREFSRRIPNLNTTLPSDSTVLPQSFNSDTSYRSDFQPKVMTDEYGQKLIEMNLDIGNYQPSDIKISVNGNDLIVQAEHTEDQPLTGSSRAYFYKQTTLPNNTDLKSLKSQYHPNGRLQITANLLDQLNSLK